MRDVTEAHFLHQRQGLEPVFRPPVPRVTALAWIPGREELVACSEDGSMHIIDPVLGTRVAHRDLGEVNVLSLHPDRKRWLGLTRSGEWMVGRFGGGIEHRGQLWYADTGHDDRVTHARRPPSCCCRRSRTSSRARSGAPPAGSRAARSRARTRDRARRG